MFLQKLTAALMFSSVLATAQAALPGLRVEPVSGGTNFYIKNTSTQQLTAFFLELDGYPGSGYLLMHDESSSTPIVPGEERRLQTTNMTPGAVPEYMKLQAALYADGTSAGKPEKVAQLAEHRRVMLETAQALKERIEKAKGDDPAALVTELRKWANSIPEPARSERTRPAGINAIDSKNLIERVARQLESRLPGGTTAPLGASGRAPAASKSPGEIVIDVDGKPFTTFHKGEVADKPFLAPLRSASGKIVTRRFPMETVPGESRDHLHHKGMWLGYNDVNGVKFWEIDASYTKPGIGKIVTTKAEYKGSDRGGNLITSMDWRDPADKLLVVQDTVTTFRGDAKLRIIDVDATLTAAVDVTFGDSHDGLLAIRLAEPFTQKGGGKIVDSEGRVGMLQVWGKHANWVDYTGEVEGERIGVAFFDNPRNPRAPTRWHARDYGLVSANPIADNVFDQNAPETKLKLAKGSKLHYQWRVVIHPGDASGRNVEELYKDYMAGK